MLPVGGDRVGSPSVDRNEPCFEGQCCKGQGPAAFKGERDTSGLDRLKETLTKPMASNKDIPVGTLTDPFPKLLNTLHTFKLSALVCNNISQSESHLHVQLLVQFFVLFF